MRNRSITYVVALAFVALMTSCGSDNSSMSKAEFVSKANALCTSFSETISNPEVALGPGSTEEQVTTFITDVLVPEFSSTINAIRGLGFPEGDEVVVETMLAETENVLSDLAADPGATLTMSMSPFTSVNIKLKDYGLTVCAES